MFSDVVFTGTHKVERILSAEISTITDGFKMFLWESKPRRNDLGQQLLHHGHYDTNLS